MNSKILTSFFIIYFSCFSYSCEENSQGFSSGEINEKINKYNLLIADLKQQWEICDNLWETVGRLEKNSEFSPMVDVKILCNHHEKVLRDITHLNHKIEELKSKESTLIN